MSLHKPDQKTQRNISLKTGKGNVVMFFIEIIKFFRPTCSRCGDRPIAVGLLPYRRNRIGPFVCIRRGKPVTVRLRYDGNSFTVR